MREKERGGRLKVENKDRGEVESWKFSIGV